MKSAIASACLVPLAAMSADAGEVPPLSLDMFEIIAGDDWKGSLTYLNYQAPFEDVTIQADVEISLVEAGLKLDYKYPNEPHANSSVLAEITDAGMVFMNEPIVAHTLTDDGIRTVTTAFSCEDMGRPAQCEMTYSFSADALDIKKMVTYESEAEAFRRNAYSFQR